MRRRDHPVGAEELGPRGGGRSRAGCGEALTGHVRHGPTAAALPAPGPPLERGRAPGLVRPLGSGIVPRRYAVRFRVSSAHADRHRQSRTDTPMGYGVIGSTSDSGSLSLGSSPGTPACDGAVRLPSGVSGRSHAVEFSAVVPLGEQQSRPPSSRGPRTPPSHGGNRGSNPLGGTTTARSSTMTGLFCVWPLDGHVTGPMQARHGFSRLCGGGLR